MLAWLPTSNSVWLLLQRYLLEYRQLWKALIIRDLLDRLLFLFAFGFGMGAILRTMEGVPYLAWLAPGIAAASGMMIMTMAMTFGAYERFTAYRVWQSWLATPIRLPDILLAELLYAALRSLPSLFFLLLLCWLLGALPSVTGTLLALPVIIFANFTYGAIALCFTAHIRRSLYFAYVNTLWTMPMYLFSGVFFDLSETPMWMQVIANIFPLTHVLNIVRPLMIGDSVAISTVLLSLLALLGTFLTAFGYALFRFDRRLRD